MNMPKVNIVIPTIGTEGYIVDLLQQIYTMDDDIVRNVFVYDNGMPAHILNGVKMFTNVTVIPAQDKNLYEMWNQGVKDTMIQNPDDYIAILNDDLILRADNFFSKLVEPLDIHEDIWATSANWDWREYPDYYQKWDTFPGTRKDNGFAGFCFAVKGQAYQLGLPLFETRYQIWCGDDDFLVEIYKHGGKTAMAIEAKVEHIDGGSKSFGDLCRLPNEINAKDVELYMLKHHTVGAHNA